MDTVIVDQSSWGQIVVTGPDRVRFLQGMLTNDVAKLAPGAWCRAAMLNVKGRVLAVADVVNEGERFLLVTEPVLGDKLLGLLEKHAIADDVSFERLSRPLHRVWDSVEAVWSAPPVFAPPPSPPSPPEAVEARRIEAGLPRYGADVSEDVFPFEANLDRGISFSKGCYVGQEVVVRASTRGAVKKKLVGLWLAGPPATPNATVATADRPDAGHVTSWIVSPRLGPIALAYLHHTAWEPGTRVQVAGAEATVAPLPFPDSR
jgi:folate-binding protein YgfZ